MTFNKILYTKTKYLNYALQYKCQTNSEVWNKEKQQALTQMQHYTLPQKSTTKQRT